ncbi:MAG: hypothetical protein U0900_21405 [Myxococcota bacterium]
MDLRRLVRLLVFMPLAAIVSLLLIGSTAALVSALEHEREAVPTMPVALVDESCDVLRHELHTLSHTLSPCELPPVCQGSPLLCPVALDARIEHEYARLRDALHDRCGLARSLVDFAWEAGQQIERGDHCAFVHDRFEAAARGEARPESYSF